MKKPVAKILLSGVVLAGVLLALTMTRAQLAAPTAQPDPIEQQFNELSARISERLATPEARFRGPLLPAWDLYQDIAALGPAALPYVVPKIEQGEWWYGLSVGMMTQKTFDRDEYADGGHYGDSITKAAMFAKWWRDGAEVDAALFARRYDALLATRQSGDATAIAAAQRSMRNLGISALPLLAEKIAHGDTESIGIATAIVPMGIGRRRFTTPSASTAAEFAAWWAANKQDWQMVWPKLPAEQPND